MRYALNVLAVEGNRVPPEGPFDVALTNGLAAIITYLDDGDEAAVVDSRHWVRSARQLLPIAAERLPDFSSGVYRELLDITQPAWHGGADDEWLLTKPEHLQAMIDLDRRPGLGVLESARHHRTVDGLLVELYSAAALEAGGYHLMGPKDQLEAIEPSECDECLRTTFVADQLDDFGGYNSTGRCLACGYERESDVADDMAFTDALRQHDHE